MDVGALIGRMPGVRLVMLFAVAVLIGAASTRADDKPSSPARAPHFKVKDVRGTSLDLVQLVERGPVILDFWATWCRPCVESLPELQAWHRRYASRGLTVIGVSVDGPRNFAKVLPFTASRGITYPIVLDKDGELQRLYHVLAIPTAFLIDTSGAIVTVRTAYRPGEGDRLEELIRARLPAPAE